MVARIKGILNGKQQDNLHKTSPRLKIFMKLVCALIFAKLLCQNHCRYAATYFIYEAPPYVGAAGIESFRWRFYFNQNTTHFN